MPHGPEVRLYGIGAMGLAQSSEPYPQFSVQPMPVLVPLLFRFALIAGRSFSGPDSGSRQTNPGREVRTTVLLSGYAHGIPTHVWVDVTGKWGTLRRPASC